MAQRSRISEISDRIAAYRLAYAEANGAEPPFRILYEKGWIEFRSRNSSTVTSRRRLSSFAQMTSALEARVSLPVLTHPEAK